MSEINLIDWRKNRRYEFRQRLIIFLILSLILGFLLVIVINYRLKSFINLRQYHNYLLQTEIRKSNDKIEEIKTIKKKRVILLSRIEHIQGLHRKTLLIPELFNELSEKMPQDAYLKKVEQRGRKITLVGFAKSNQAISKLIKALEKNVWLQTPKLDEIRKNEILKLGTQFKFSFLMHPIKRAEN